VTADIAKVQPARDNDESLHRTGLFDVEEVTSVRPDDIVEMLQQKPFQRFRIFLSDGTVYEIRHAELVKVGRSKILIFFPTASPMRFSNATSRHHFCTLLGSSPSHRLPRLHPPDLGSPVSGSPAIRPIQVPSTVSDPPAPARRSSNRAPAGSSGKR